MEGSHDTAVCELCRRHVPRRLITQHHVKPKSEGGKHSHKTPLCKPCHKQVHATFSNKELAKALRRHGGAAQRRVAPTFPEVDREAEAGSQLQDGHVERTSEAEAMSNS
jgi:5-methylcytosine-specific restriction endonuclease McrA